MINSNKNRFEQLSFKIFSCLESLPLEKLYSPDVSEETEQTLSNMYVDKNDVIGWKIKANVLQTTLTGNEVNSFKDDYKCLRVPSKIQQEMISNALHVTKLLLANPAALCTPGRSFLTARRLKIWLRTTTKSRRFNSLSFIKQV